MGEAGRVTLWRLNNEARIAAEQSNVHVCAAWVSPKDFDSLVVEAEQLNEHHGIFPRDPITCIVYLGCKNITIKPDESLAEGAILLGFRSN